MKIASRATPEGLVGHGLSTTALYHNFWTQNLSRSSKVSKDSGCSLVSQKSFSEILPSNGFGPGPGKVGQNCLKVLHLWRHSKNPHPPTKNFFWVQTARLAESFELFTGSVALTRPEKFPRKVTCDLVVFAYTALINLDVKVLNHLGNLVVLLKL